MRLHYTVNDGQAQPGTVRLGGKKRLKNPLAQLSGNPRAIVLNDNPHITLIKLGNRYLYISSLTHRINRIIQ